MFGICGYSPASSFNVWTNSITCSNQVIMEVPSHGALCCRSLHLHCDSLEWDDPHFLSPRYNIIVGFQCLFLCCCYYKRFVSKHAQIFFHLLAQHAVHHKEEPSYYPITFHQNPPTSNKLQVSTSICEISHVSTSCHLCCFPLWIYIISSSS